jgi:hypothetical protein
MSIENCRTFTGTLNDNEILMIVRNMSGQDMNIVVKKEAYVIDVQCYISKKLGVGYDNVILMLDLNIPNMHAKVHSIQDLLKKKCNVIDLLIGQREYPPLEFVCPNCKRECRIWECMKWTTDTSKNPFSHCDHAIPHICCNGNT